MSRRDTSKTATAGKMFRVAGLMFGFSNMRRKQ